MSCIETYQTDSEKNCNQRDIVLVDRIRIKDGRPSEHIAEHKIWKKGTRRVDEHRPLVIHIEIVEGHTGDGEYCYP